MLARAESSTSSLVDRAAESGGEESESALTASKTDTSTSSSVDTVISGAADTSAGAMMERSADSSATTTESLSDCQRTLTGEDFARLQASATSESEVRGRGILYHLFDNFVNISGVFFGSYIDPSL